MYGMSFLFTEYRRAWRVSSTCPFTSRLHMIPCRYFFSTFFSLFPNFFFLCLPFLFLIKHWSKRNRQFVFKHRRKRKRYCVFFNSILASNVVALTVLIIIKMFKTHKYLASMTCCSYQSFALLHFTHCLEICIFI